MFLCKLPSTGAAAGSTSLAPKKKSKKRKADDEVEEEFPNECVEQQNSTKKSNFFFLFFLDDLNDPFIDGEDSQDADQAPVKKTIQPFKKGFFNFQNPSLPFSLFFKKKKKLAKFESEIDSEELEKFVPRSEKKPSVAMDEDVDDDSDENSDIDELAAEAAAFIKVVFGIVVFLLIGFV